MNDGYMDAAAVPVPDAGDDTLLREQLAVALDACQPAIRRVDLLLAVAREHVAAAVQAERERAHERERTLDGEWQVRWRRECDRADKAEAAKARVLALADQLNREHDGSLVTSDYPMVARRIRAALDETEATP